MELLKRGEADSVTESCSCVLQHMVHVIDYSSIHKRKSTCHFFTILLLLTPLLTLMYSVNYVNKKNEKLEKQRRAPDSSCFKNYAKAIIPFTCTILLQKKKKSKRI